MNNFNQDIRTSELSPEIQKDILAYYLKKWKICWNYNFKYYNQIQSNSNPFPQIKDAWFHINVLIKFIFCIFLYFYIKHFY